MIHETLNNTKTEIEHLLCSHEIQFKSVRVAHYREASYFAFEGSYAYMILDCSFSGDVSVYYIGETSNLGPNLRKHARNHRFTHAFVVDLDESEKTTREFVKRLLIEKFGPEFQGHYSSFEIYRTNNFQRALETNEVSEWQKQRLTSLSL